MNWQYRETGRVASLTNRAIVLRIKLRTTNISKYFNYKKLFLINIA